MNWLDFEQKLNRKGQRIFTPLDVVRIMDKSEVAVRFFLHRYTKRGALIYLKKGFYALKTNMPNELEIANKIYAPSYVSLEYALSFYKVIPETVYTITSLTTKATREFTVSDIIYKYNKIRKDLFFGYEPIKKDNALILMATPEKALVDYLYFVSLKKKSIPDRMNFKSLDKRKLYLYAKKFKRDNLTKIIKEAL
jgi:predicted transcriptional regulator of viral defense system